MTNRSLVRQLKYYITPAHDCSYLESTPAQMVFVDPKQPFNQMMLSQLSRFGFRRSGDFVYRPECDSCHQCFSCRIPVQDFRPNSQQKKTTKRNQDLKTVIRPIVDLDAEHYALYERYIEARHADGDMYPPSFSQFEKFLKTSCGDSFFFEFWLDDQLLGVSVCDLLDDGISAVYTFFDPLFSRRSLGVYAILSMIEQAQKVGLPYIYLGYWVPQSEKMSYKIEFEPLQIFIQEQWIVLAPEEVQLQKQEMLQRRTQRANRIPTRSIDK